jgi:Transmembrane secretion effector
MTAEATAAHADAPSVPSGWAPLRTPAFRRLWTAQFVSNVGSWMQTVAAQWVMTSLTTSTHGRPLDIDHADLDFVVA